MTMTSVAVAPGSLGASPAMLTPNMYHLQQGLNAASVSPTPGKSYDTLGKSKKSWSVRLGLSRQHHGPDEKGWGTISGGSALSRQMIYGDPWLYGTVRSSRPGHEARAFLTAAAAPPPPGAPLLVVCSCPEFLRGTTRKLGSCRKCGGHRLAGVPLGGTCRLPAPSSRSRPSLAGFLRSSRDDPYDQMRRNRLVEPRSRARSISPHRPSCQRAGSAAGVDSRSQSVARKERKGSIEATASRSEWFEKDGGQGYEDSSRKSRQSYGAGSSDEWSRETTAISCSKSRGRSAGSASGKSGQSCTIARKNRSTRSDWQDCQATRSRIEQEERDRREASASSSTATPSSALVAPPTAALALQPLGGVPGSTTCLAGGVPTPLASVSTTSAASATPKLATGADSRRSILECDVNPYLLLKKQRDDEDDLSDDLSDNALEQEEPRSATSCSSSLFDSSKVKSIERIPKRSAVAAIGGQRIRVFNEPREISDEDEEDDEDDDEDAEDYVEREDDEDEIEVDRNGEGDDNNNDCSGGKKKARKKKDDNEPPDGEDGDDEGKRKKKRKKKKSPTMVACVGVEQNSCVTTRIPIAKISPKRPPRRLKEARQTLKSILKRGRVLESKRKNVLFKVDNVIFAPEKPSEATRLSWGRIGRFAGCVSVKSRRNVQSEEEEEEEETEEPEEDDDNGRERKIVEMDGKGKEERAIVAEEQREKHKFITVPNIRDPKVDRIGVREVRIVPETKIAPLPSRNDAKIDKCAGSKRPTPVADPTRNRYRDVDVEKGTGGAAGNGYTACSTAPTRIGSQAAVAAVAAIATTTSPVVGDSRVERRAKDEAQLEMEGPKERSTRVAVDEKEECPRRSQLTRSQSDRSFSRPEVSAGDVLFADTMRLSLCKRVKDSSSSSLGTSTFSTTTTTTVTTTTTSIASGDSASATSTSTSTGNSAPSIENATGSTGNRFNTEDNKKMERKAISVVETGKSWKDEVLVDENSSLSSSISKDIATKTTDQANDQSRDYEGTGSNEHFRRMRPTSWSPPPGRQKHRFRTSDPGIVVESNDASSISQDHRRSMSSASSSSWTSRGSSRIEIGSKPTESNVCKITVSPRASPLVHRLQIGAAEAPQQRRAARRTSILINGDSQTTRGAGSAGVVEIASQNKVTISVGGEDSVCNPTVISVNSEEPPKIKSPVAEVNRTLVILDNYRSNIVVESVSDEARAKRPRQEVQQGAPSQQGRARDNSDVEKNLEETTTTTTTTTLKSKEERCCSSKFGEARERSRPTEQTGIIENKKGRVKESDGGVVVSSMPCVSANTTTDTATSTTSTVVSSSSASKWSELSKEAIISKLLEDSLRKARENGEILGEDSGEAILKILKQSLLGKGKEYESSESTIEPSYSRSSSLNSEADFASTGLFLEENPYEVIKEPIYEEIPEEPPPLPLSPPPTEDYVKGRLYFADLDYYKKVIDAGDRRFLGSYLSADDVFKKRSDNNDEIAESYLISKSPEDFFKKMSTSPEEEEEEEEEEDEEERNNISTKFDLLNFLMDTKSRVVNAATAGDEDDDEDDDEVEEEEEEEEDEEEDAEGDLEALYEQKETSLGDLSSKSSQISNVSDSSEECNIILANSPETLKSRTVDIERTDSGVGSESSQASSTRGVARRWRSGNVSSGPGSLLGGIPQVISGDTKLCEDCEQRLDPLITDSGVVYAPFVCRKCSKKRAERKEIITEIVETEQKYGRDLQIILEEFHRPMLRAGLLTSDQLSAIFLNVEELLEHNLVLAEKLKDSVDFAQESGDEDLLTVDVGKIFLESERMLHAFESYCTRQGSASLLLQNLEKEKELLRIFLKVSQMDNTVLRRMNLNSFLMVPVQRVTKYPLLLARLLKATPSVRSDIQEAKKRLKQAQTNIELHLEHMNAEAKDVTSTKLWRRISIIQNGRRLSGEQDMVNIKLRKMAVEVLGWAHEEARFVLEGRLLVAQPTDNNWRRGRTVKLAPVTAMLVTNGKPTAEYLEFTDDSLFPRHIGIKEATLLLVKEKIGRYSLLREPLYLDKCIVCCETDFEDYFEVQELSSKETFIFKAEDGARTKRWCRTLQAHAQSLGAWRKRRGALPNIMICSVARN